MVQVCRERREGKDPDMSVLLGLRCELAFHRSFYSVCFLVRFEH